MSNTYTLLINDDGVPHLESGFVSDDFVLKADLRKLVAEIRADQYESADVNIWYSDGCKDSADRIERLLGGE